jgi:hypothetical protein
VGKIKVWNAATTTSLSGLHLGHHKCLICEIDIPQEGGGEELERNQKKMLDANYKRTPTEQLLLLLTH